MTRRCRNKAICFCILFEGGYELTCYGCRQSIHPGDCMMRQERNHWHTACRLQSCFAVRKRKSNNNPGPA